MHTTVVHSLFVIVGGEGKNEEDEWETRCSACRYMLSASNSGDSDDRGGGGGGEVGHKEPLRTSGLGIAADMVG